MKLLIVEDEWDLSNSIVAYLNSENYQCEQAFTFKEAKLKINVYDYDCILLDLMLPDGNGLDLLKEIRSKKDPVGVIILSAKGSLDDKVEGLKIGADDYLAKPFHMAELSMRIYAIIRRREFLSGNLLQSGNVCVDMLGKIVTVCGHPLVLTRTEYELLLFLVSNKNKVISKSTIAEHLSGDMADMLDNYDFIYTHIKNLKSKMARYDSKDYIHNIYGMGYKWKEE